MRPEVIQDTTRLWQAQPEKAKGRPAVKARSDGSRALLEAGSFTWHADLPPSVGGGNEAPSPTALLLSALAGCAVVFVRDTLGPQLGVRIDRVEATAQCETDSRGLLGMEGAAPDLQNVQLDIRIQSPDREDAIEKLYEVWRARCPIYLALLKPMAVKTTLEITKG